MDTKLILYLAFILLWAAFKYYQKNQKAKNSRASRPVGTPNPQSTNPNYKSIFEKLLLGEEFTAPAKTKDNDEWDNESDMLPVLPIASQQQTEVVNEVTNNVALKETYKTENISTQIKTKFNLKQAFIYSTILNRPY